MEDRAPLGLLITAIGAAALAISVFEPWYRVSSHGGHHVATLTAHEAFKFLAAVLLFLAGLALIASIFPLAGIAGLRASTGGQIALIGASAGVVTVVRMLWRPGAEMPLVSLTLAWGSWISLASAGLIAIGGLLASSPPTRKRANLGYVPHSH
jgi:hypothetical protein